MALTKLMYPIVSIIGRYDNAYFRSLKAGLSMRSLPPHRIKHKNLAVAPKILACRAFKVADLLYQDFDQATKDKWRKAVKKPNKSPYDLWMQECLTCFNAGRNAPETPSISGGYSNDKVLCDGNFPAPL